MLKKGLWITLGWGSLILGGIGAVVPVLPTFPFMLFAAFCFGKGSKKRHQWFINTKFYQRNLESYAAGKGMTAKAKAHVVTVVTLIMAFGFFMMRGLFFPRILLGIVWISHVVYFVFKVNTIRNISSEDCREKTL